jgi:hypothetical protein
MNLREAQNLANSWTCPADVGQGGWKEVIFVLNNAVNGLVLMNTSLVNAVNEKTTEIEKLSLDLGIKDKCFVTQGTKNDTP